MMRNQLPDSAYQAQEILGAWRSGDTHRFNHELERVDTILTDRAGAEESERMELLRAITAELRSPAAQSSPADDPQNIYGSLLRHLAFPGRALSARAAFLQ